MNEDSFPPEPQDENTPAPKESSQGEGPSDQAEAARFVTIKAAYDPDRFFSLVNRIHHERRTGVLRVSNNQVAKNIYFLKGNLIDVRSEPFQPSECLGRVLQRAGKLDQNAVVESLRRKKAHGTLQGQELVKMGLMSPGFIDEALRAQIEVKLYDIMEWDSGQMVFTERELYWGMDLNRRDSRVLGLVRMGTSATASPLRPAWMRVSWV